MNDRCSYCGTTSSNCPNAEGEACCMGCWGNQEPCLCGTDFTCLAVHHEPDVEGMGDLCHHCGQAPESDGGHSCPCAFSDADRPNQINLG